LYVDEDVVLTGKTGSITIKAGEYSYSNQPGTIDYAGHTFSYYGTVIVKFE